jgi:glutaminase
MSHCGESARETAAAAIPIDADPREYRLFRSLDLENRGSVRVADLLDVFERVGLAADDHRIAETLGALRGYALKDRIDFESFCGSIRPDILIVEQVLQGNLVIPDFAEFCSVASSIYEATRERREGQVADYIPQLARMDPEAYAVAICTTDGQRLALGDASREFCVQSSSKPITYALALEEHGDEVVHRYVGREPSGRNFNELALNDDGKPHNPMINAGAIMCSSLIRPDLDAAERFDYVLDRWRALCGHARVGFDNSVYQSERQTADRNYALGYYMRENRAFPTGADLLETLEFYFQSCSIEANAEMMSVLAATLANGGVCPTTGERVLKTGNVRHVLTLMSSCGMYDFSGEFAFGIGLPAKSGVSGVMVVVIPNVMGLCVWSPRVDSHGNSVRGIEFCRELVRRFNFHSYDNLTGVSEKLDPRLTRVETVAGKVDQLIWAASKGDLGAVHRLVVRGYDQDAADYDRRTPLHLAAAEGRERVVHYLVENGAGLSPRDRWGRTPLDDARGHGHESLCEWLEAQGAEATGSSDPGTGSANGRDQRAPVTEQRGVVELIYAAAEGDLRAIQRLVARGVDLDVADYDLRTPLHLAAAEGHEEIVQFFIDQGVELSPRDRWGGTPDGDARRHGHTRVTRLFESSVDGRNLERSEAANRPAPLFAVAGS